ncbi:hypothetical protein P9112_003343 [Eukaryota sp. TZLM1-RC]
MLLQSHLRQVSRRRRSFPTVFIVLGVLSFLLLCTFLMILSPNSTESLPSHSTTSYVHDSEHHTETSSPSEPSPPDHGLSSIPHNNDINLPELPEEDQGMEDDSLLPGKRVLKPDGMDAVVLWVNGSDPTWIAERDQRAGKKLDSHSKEWSDIGEVVYSLRGIWCNLPNLRHVFLVVSGPSQVPCWLNQSNAFITVVYHQDIFPDSSMLPTFSSYAIEANLWRIPGISDYFYYFNDDMVMVRPLPLDLVFNPSTNSPLVHIEHWWKVTSPTGNSYNRGLYQGIKLLEKVFSPPQSIKSYHAMAHTWYLLNKNIMREVSEEFSTVYNRIISTPFRPPNGFPHFMHLCNHYWVQKSLLTKEDELYNAEYHQCYHDEYVFGHLGKFAEVQKLFKRAEKKTTYSMCLNDPGFREQKSVELYRKKMAEFLPKPAPWEIGDVLGFYEKNSVYYSAKPKMESGRDKSKDSRARHEEILRKINVRRGHN